MNPKPTRPLRIAVIGAGAHPESRARQYLATIDRLREHYTLAAVCDRDPEVSRQAAALYGAAARYTRARDLFAADKYDVVLSMAPKDSHVVIALNAARHGAHVITEIPVALTRRYAEAIARTCREQGVLWEVAEQVPFWPQECLKQQIVASGLLGRVTHARLWYQTGPYHGLSAVRALVGAEARRVLGACGAVVTEPYVAYGGEPESTAEWESAVIEFGSGVVCLFEKPPGIFGHFRCPIAMGWQVEGTRGYLDRNRLLLYAAAGAQTFDLRDEYVEVDGRRVLDHVRVDTEPPVVWENPFKAYGIGAPDDVAKASILTRFHEAVTGGGTPRYGVENGLRDWEICLAVRESARRGNAWVTLPLGEPTELEQQIEAEFRRRYGHDPIEETDALLETPFTRSATLWKVAQWL